MKKKSNNSTLSSSHQYPSKPITIEATGKKWKAFQLLSAFVAIVGMIIITVDRSSTFSCLLVFFGIAGFIVARIGAWWHHG